MKTDWSAKVITEYLEDRVQASGPFDAIITFDEGGVSLHPNHRACYNAIRHLTESSILSPSMSLYALQTVPVTIKFLSLPLAVARQLIPANPLHRVRFLSSLKGYFIAIRAMTAHQSQLVWFRYLYIMTSIYMYNNELIRI